MDSSGVGDDEAAEESAPAASERSGRSSVSSAVTRLVSGLGRIGAPLDAVAGGRIPTGDYGRAVWGGVVVLFGAGLLLAAWQEPVGLTVLCVSATVAFLFVVLRHGPGSWRRGGPLARGLLLAAAPLAAVLVVGLRWDGISDAAGVWWAAITAMLIVAVGIAGPRGFGEAFGPFLPESTRPPLDDAVVRWVWSGGLTQDRASVVCRVLAGVDEHRVRLVVHDEADGDGHVSVEAETPGEGIVRFRVSGLVPDREYAYDVRVGDEVGGIGRLRTLPTGRPASFRFAAASCASTGSRGVVFDHIAELDPQLFVHLGDLHYENIGTSDATARIHAAYDDVLSSPSQAHLYRQVPIARIWDDHDYGRNNSDHWSASRLEAEQVFRQVVPYDRLVEPHAGPIHHAVQLGRVRLLLTDTRSERNRVRGELIGPAQQRWLIDEVVQADPATTRLVVWCAAVPWIGDSDPDTWAGYAAQRQTIANALADRRVGLLYVAGDAHMMALDGGDHSDYSDAGAGGFPVVNAAALDRRGSEKGGTYDYGPVPGAGQFAIVDVIDPGDADDLMAVRVVVRRWDDSQMGSMTFTVDGDGRLTVMDGPEREH